MFCRNCGTALPDGALFCGACGTSQAIPQAPVAEVPAPVAEVPAPVAEVPAPVAEVPAPVVAVSAPVAEAPAQPAFVDPFAPAQPEPAKPKKKGKGLLIAGIALVAAAAVFVTCIAGPLWFGWFPNSKLTKQITKWFGSDEAYMSAVEAETVDTLSNSISMSYGTAINTFKEVLAGNKYASTTISLEMGDTVKELIHGAITGAVGNDNPSVDAAQISQLLSLLDGASISVSGGMADDVYKMAMGMGLGGEELLSVAYIFDLANLKAFAAIPTISDTYIEMSQIFEDLDVEDVAAVGQATDLLEALPSEEVVNNLLKKYIQLALDQFTDVSKDSDTIKVGGIEEKVTVLKTKIGQKDLMKAAKAVMKELKKDSAVEKVLVDLGDAVGAINGQEGYGQQLYDSFVEALGMVDSMDDEIATYDDDDEDASYILLTDYVNSAHEIVGRKITACYGDEKEDMLYYATATKGKDYAFELEVRDQKILTGKGTNQKGIINGTYTIDGTLVFGMRGEDESMDLATIKVENFDSNGFKANCLKGTFTITPGAEIMQQFVDNADLPAEITSAISLLDCSLKIEADMGADGNGYVKVALCNGSKNLLGIRIDTKLTDEKVSVPSTDKVLDAENIEQWLDTVDLSKLVDTLKKLGLPSEIIDALESEEGLEGFKQGFLNGFGGATEAPEDNWNDIYGDDYYDDYYGDTNDEIVDWEDIYGDDWSDDWESGFNDEEIVWGDTPEEEFGW